MNSLIRRIPIRQRAIFLIAILLLILPPTHLHAYANCKGWTAADASGNTIGGKSALFVAGVLAFVPGMQLEAFGFLVLGFAAEVQNWYCGGGGGVGKNTY